MKKVFLLAAAVFAFAFAEAYSLEVDRDEISVETSGVDFINYTGAHDQINTREEIQAIGALLGLEIRPLPADRLARVGNDRYRIVHAVDPSETGGFDADILILGATAGVDHVTNLRRIISGYLSSAYGYPARDADTLSIFITVYNAIHRGDMGFFQARYKNVVTSELAADSVGLARVYSEWPGKTQIVIPLSDPMFSGTLSSVETSALAEPDVIASIRTEESSQQDIRRDMADLMERESDEADERAAQARTEAAQARTEAEMLGREAEEAQEQADAARREAERAASEAEARPDDAEARRAASESASAAEEMQREADSLREQQREAEQRAADAETRAEQEQELADSRLDSADQERRSIASDRQEELDRAAAARRETAADDNRQEEVASSGDDRQEDAADTGRQEEVAFAGDDRQEERDRETASRETAAIAEANTTAALRVVNQDGLLSEIILVNAASGSVMRTSALNSIRNRTLLDTGEAYMAVAGQGQSVRLVLIDRLTLDIIKESEQAIAAESVLVSSGNDYYVVVSNGGSFCIGRFDRNLNLQATSAVQVQPFTAITVSEGRIIVQDTSSRMRILQATDLTDLNG